MEKHTTRTSKRNNLPDLISARAKVFVLYCGGTIGSVGKPLHPASFDEFNELVAQQAGFSRDPITGKLCVEIYYEESEDCTLNIELQTATFENPMDSSSMTPSDWALIARKVLENYDGNDGIVVLHGTDTMAFTASALSYMLGRGVSKPVILTGSQIPLSKTRNDALRNLVTSMALAATKQVTEVGLFFNNHLWRGNRSVKVSASDFPAFSSPKFKPLATAGIKILFHKHKLLGSPPRELQLCQDTNRQQRLAELAVVEETIAQFSVISVVLFPGIRHTMVQAMLEHTDPPVRGVVIQAFGAGNAPGDDKLMKVLADAHSGNLRGGEKVVLVDVTQVLGGTVDLDAYESACAIKEAGAISGYDLTPEAALCKLVYLIARQGNNYVQTDVENAMTNAELGDLANEESQDQMNADWAHTLVNRGLSWREQRHRKRLRTDLPE